MRATVHFLGQRASHRNVCRGPWEQGWVPHPHPPCSGHQAQWFPPLCKPLCGDHGWLRRCYLYLSWFKEMKAMLYLNICCCTFVCIGEGNGSPLQHSCLENPVDRRAWWAAVYGVAQSWTRLKRLSRSSSSSIHMYSKLALEQPPRNSGKIAGF